KSIAKNIRRHVNHRSGVEHGVDAALAVIPHHQAAELQPGIDKVVFRMAPHFDRIKCILQVGGVRVSPQITPFPDHRTSQKSVMCLVAEREEHGIAYFATDLAVWSNRCVAPHFSSHIDMRAFTKSKCSADNRSLVNDAVLTQVYRSVFCIDDRRSCGHPLLDKQIFFSINDGVSVSKSERLSAGGEKFKVRLDL